MGGSRQHLGMGHLDFEACKPSIKDIHKPLIQEAITLSMHSILLLGGLGGCPQEN